MFWQCTDCKFGSNSPKEADKHASATGHAIAQEDD